MEILRSQHVIRTIYRNAAENVDAYIVLVSGETPEGQQITRDIYSLHRQDFVRLTDHCFGYSGIREVDMENMYINCFVFTIDKKTSIETLQFFMSIRSKQMDTEDCFFIYSVCKNPEVDVKNMFKTVLKNAYENDIRLRQKPIYLDVLFDNPYICAALCAYIRTGFLPHSVKEDHVVMKLRLVEKLLI